MKQVLEYIATPISGIGNIIFELDEASLSIFEPGTNLIVEMGKYDSKYKSNKQRGNRTVWNDTDGNPLQMGNHATERQNRPVDKGGDGKPIKEHEIVDMFIWAWNDIMNMYKYGKLKDIVYPDGHTSNSFVISSKAYIVAYDNEGKLLPDNGYPYINGNIPQLEVDKNNCRQKNETLWAAWMASPNMRTQKLDIIIRTIFRGVWFNHSAKQERIWILNDGKVRQIFKK